VETFGRWRARRAVRRPEAHVAWEAGQQNAAAAAVYYAPGAVVPEATRSALAHRQARVLVVSGGYDVALPPQCADEYAGLFGQAELAVQPGGGHSPWLDDPEWFVRTATEFFAPIRHRPT
jgi:pimeloyl-ACP methyl ester carboxylesterase